MKCSDCNESIVSGEEFQKIINDEIQFRCIHCFLKDLKKQELTISQELEKAGL